MKIYNYDIVFREIPDEVSLAISISGCPNRCEGCHSPWLRDAVGTELTETDLCDLIEKYANQITCVLFMGGDAVRDEVFRWAGYLKSTHKTLKTAWYSGNDYVDHRALNGLFDYVKFGSYKAEYGPLNSPTTNQVLLKYDGGLLYNVTKHVR